MTSGILKKLFAPVQKTDLNPSSSSNDPSKKPWFDFIWPIQNSELPKFLSITLLMFCILGIQNLIRAMKDSVIITMIGTETTSFLKFWGVMPTAFLITIGYVKMVNVMKGETIFYTVMSCFLGFFGLFAFVLFPNHQTIHLSSSTSSYLIEQIPHLKWFILLLSNWSFSLFYIIAELWPNAVFALLFWQFVNKITTIDESKRFYPIFALFGQTGLVIFGQFLVELPFINKYLINKYDLLIKPDILSLQLVISIVLTLGIIALLTFWLINNKILDIATVEGLQFKVKKNQLTLRESIYMVARSRYIRLIIILLVSYGVAINLVEGPWKASASKLYKTPTEFAAFVGNYLSYTGVLTIIFSILGSNIVRKFGWFFAAILTPLMVFITGLGFFIMANFDFAATLMVISFAITDPLLFVIYIGAIQNVLTKSSKYTLFDSTKEMSYVPLGEELKTKGKAAADVLGTKLGKSLSAFLQSTIFIILPAATYESISLLLMVIFTIVCIIWIWGVRELSKEYQKACSAHQGEEVIL